MMVFTAKVDTLAANVMSLVAVSAPRMATPPTSSGSAAAARPPKMKTSSTNTTGNAIFSPLPRSALTIASAVASTAVVPPTWVVSPGAFMAGRSASYSSFSPVTSGAARRTTA
jgi:hypothetical protein